MRLTSALLSPEDQSRVHAASLEILQKAGVRFYSDKALGLLEKAGARLDTENKIAFIPAELVQHALAQAPRAFTLGARNPAYDYPLPSPVTRYALDGTATFMIDFESGQRRYGTRRDNEQAFHLFQRMEMGVMAWPAVSISDAPAPSRALHEFFSMMRGCSKHGQHELHSVEQAPYLAAAMEAVMGSAEAVRQRKPYSLIYCPVAPLSHDGPMLDAYLELGDYEVPVMVMPMPVSGTTGPASLYSSVCLANAEFLSTLVVFQLAHPGRPLIYSSAMGNVDFRTGGYLGGTPEMGLQSAALVAMGRSYGFPTTSAGCTSDAHQPGPEAVMEKLLTMLPVAMAGADIIVGMGEVESVQALALEQILVDNQLARLCQRLCQGVDTSPEQDLLADVLQVGPGGHFLRCKSTRQAARSGEFYTPALIEHPPFERWESLGRPDLYSRARQKVGELLAEPLLDALPQAADAALAETLRRADSELK